MSSEKSKDGDPQTEKHEIHTPTENLFTDDTVDPIYQAKAQILNNALQEIGMGRYQVSSGFCFFEMTAFDR